MKLLIAVKSCEEHQFRGYHEVIRQTWGKDAVAAGIDVRFCTAGTWARKQDEFNVYAPDTYAGLSHKVRAMCERISFRNSKYNYTHGMFVDNDTFIKINELQEMLPLIEAYDFAGQMREDIPIGETRAISDHMDDYPEGYTYPSGGLGYFLSAKAMRYVSNGKAYNWWAEDMFVGNTLGPHIKSGELSALALKDYYAKVVWHLPVPYKPMYMELAYQTGTPDIITHYECMQRMQKILGGAR